MSERLIITRPHYFTDIKSNCGYCSGQKEQNEDYYCLDSWYAASVGSNIENCTIGFQAELMSVEMYGRLCDMGYRRSGKFLYKVDMLRNCCRLYTIRTTPDQVSITKEFKSTLKRFRKQINPSGDGKRHDGEPFNYIREILETETSAKDFKTCFEPAVFTEEKYALFAKYQEHVHNDFKHNAKSFKRFLCDSPFSKETILGTKEEWEQLNNWKVMAAGEKLKRQGPAHECYYYKDELIAIAVTDFLPSGISSVYFIWDPEYHRWSLGKLSALRELCITRKTNLDFYYMGYYIDDCPKMNYKAKYGGELLDVCTQRYVPLVRLNKLKSPGKLFTIEVHPAKAERELPLNKALADPVGRLDGAERFENTVEKIYGPNGGAYQEATDSAKALSRLGIPYAVDERPFGMAESEPKDDETYVIPNVVPGLVPLKEILEMVLHGDINSLQNNVTFFDMYEGNIRQLQSFSNESPEIKRTLCDVIRLIGLENTKGVLLLL